MATGYTLQVGYLSAGNREEAWREMKAITAALRADPSAITREVLRLESGHTSESLDDYAEAYRLDSDATITIHEAIGDRPACIHQMASGGGESRDIKEAMRRAFCRLVIEAMHRKGIEVTMIVS